MTKTELILKQTCPICESCYQLIKTHERESRDCLANCWERWKQTLHQHYQQQIILHLAHQEAKKEEGQHD